MFRAQPSASTIFDEPPPYLLAGFSESCSNLILGGAIAVITWTLVRSPFAGCLTTTCKTDCMSKALITILFSIPLTLSACGGKKAEPTTTTGTGSTATTSTEGGKAACVEVMTKSRECTNEFIPALVDIRAKYNNPEGVAEAVKTDRDKVISQALTEWAVDSKDDAIVRTCEKMAAEAPATDAEAATAKECIAKVDCAGYVACIMPQFEKRFAK